MGQKVHPYGFRLGTLYGWQSNWFAERSYAEQLHEDLAHPRLHQEEARFTPGISKVVIERTRREDGRSTSTPRGRAS